MSKQDRVFVVHAPIRNMGVFEQFAELAARLKPYGRVEINVSNLAEKSAFEVPPGGSPWHEYASYNPTPHKFFPSKKLAPFLPAEHVKRNREVLEAKREIINRHGIGAAFWSYEPNFLPEAFYEKYPHLRGARSDHPRRGCKEAFSPCVDRPEVLDMIEETIAALVEAVPELGTYFFKTNDAGPGLCWSEWLYNGPNGPAFCKHRNMGERVRGMLDAINRGAEKGGCKLDVHMSGNFKESERDAIAAHLPENATLRRRSRRTLSLSSGVSAQYPLRGLFNPLALLKQMQRFGESELTTVFVDFRSSYDRGYEHPDTAAKVIDCIRDFLDEPVYGTLPMLERLHAWCEQWGGPEHAGRLFEALVALEQSSEYRRAAFPGFRMITTAASLRYLNRPLVAMPEKLSSEEESYFLPYVFNIHEHEARVDYVDVHGGRMTPVRGPGHHGTDPRVYAVDGWRKTVAGICDELESLDGAPEAAFFGKVARALRVLSSSMRSANNFWSVQVLRDRNVEALSGDGRLPAKVGSWTGDADLLFLNEFMRDELDNAAELVDLLETGGMDLVCHNECGEDEDTFLLSAELPQQIRRKMKIMRDHWLDVERYLAPPHK